ncbi:hypothetical protein BGZ70_007573 [Mortierella alpina]|uniref:Sphingomyelin synthase-like domain-containing protein n=1 Tax=Mortierella alpina TaxID=64518 RepID=A0A9P6JE77_MORAP|nr:hypothetical protein BGZ70_007573 [Mortierella alpina]
MRPWMERFKRWFFQRYKFTKQSIFWTLLCIVLFGLSLYFMNVMANVASYLSPDNTQTPKLSDRLFEAIPSITLLWLTDLADIILFVPTVLLVLTHYRPLYLLCKVLLTWALCNLMRITTIAITSFPDPRAGCIHSVGEFFSTFTLHRCGDCMFSGHTVIFVISALVWTSHGYHRFPHRLRWLAWICLIFVWCLCIGSAIIVIANRAHYTVDVLVAFYVAGGNFYIWTHIFEHYIEGKGRLKDLTRPWGEGPDPRLHIQERERKRQLAAATDPEKNVAVQTHGAGIQMQSLVTEDAGSSQGFSYDTGSNNHTITTGSNNNNNNDFVAAGYQDEQLPTPYPPDSGGKTEISPYSEELQQSGETSIPMQLPGEPYRELHTR